MKHRFDEIYFTSRGEALSHLPWLRDEEFVLYNCCRCGINFASRNPSVEFGAIICSVCDRELIERGNLR